MKINSLTIKNYKSLRDVRLEPGDFSVFVGRNGSGKSNLADAVDFLGAVYLHGLEHAVAKKGGYENIAHRKERRSRSAIHFSVELSTVVREADIFGPGRLQLTRKQSSVYDMEMFYSHEFTFQALGEGIRSEFKITYEKLTIRTRSLKSDLFGTPSSDLIELVRMSDTSFRISGNAESVLYKSALPGFIRPEEEGDFDLSPSELIVSIPIIRSRVIGPFRNWLIGISIFQLSPETSRHPGVPTPNPTLSSRGENLPAVVDWLQNKHDRDWKLVIKAMQEIVPELEEITVDYLHTKTLGLFFKEKGVGRAWSSEDVSDGTIRCLAMLVACFDPRVTFLVLEEPENALHPWIISSLVKQLRKLTDNKTIIITTHSPVILDAIHPSEVWIVYKLSGETSVKRLADFDKKLVENWEQGHFKLFDYLESGAVSEAVPLGE